MSKIILSVFLMVLTLVSFAQDSSITNTSKTKFRLVAGPELNFVNGGALSKGVLAGANVGIELNKSMGKVVGFAISLNYNYNATDRWINDNALGFTNSKMYVHTIEVPIGLKFTSTKGPKNNSFFAKAEYVNGFAVSSNMSDLVEDSKKFNYTQLESNNVVSLYNPGAKVELGVETFFNKDNSYTFSLTAKQMYLNAIGTSGPRLSTLGLGLNMGYTF